MLEGRCTPATFTVNMTTDEADPIVGDGIADVDPNLAGLQTTLRAAIQEANALAGTDLIQFDLPVNSFISLQNDLPDLSTNMSILGPAASATIFVTRAADAPNFRIFKVTAPVTLWGLGITNGNDGGIGGGGIINFSILTVVYCEVYHNFTTSLGGGIRNMYGASLDIWYSSVHLNEAASGGGISSSGWLGLNYSQITNNSGDVWGGGIYLGTGAALTSQSSQVKYNSANFAGGGIYIDNATVTFHGGKLENNRTMSLTEGYGGGFYIEKSGANTASATFDQGTSIRYNDARKGGGGYIKSGSVTLNSCDLLGNTASVLGPGIAYVLGFHPTVIGGNYQGHVVDPPANPNP